MGRLLASPLWFDASPLSFVIYCVGATQVVCGFLSEACVLYVPVGLVCSWEDVRSRASLYCHLKPDPNMEFLMLVIRNYFLEFLFGSFSEI